MKKMNYKKPLVEVMVFDAADILSTEGSSDKIDGTLSGTMSDFSMTTSSDAASIILNNN